jgi:hypothetical protein
MENTLKHSLNELRQEKEYGYVVPRSEINYNKINLDPQHIIDLVKKYPNDSELGKNIRGYLIHLGVYGK